VNPVSTDSGRVLRWGFLAAAAGVSGGVGRGSRQKGLLTAFKMLDMAQRRWRRVNSAELVLLVRAGVTFIDGLLAERVAVGEDAA